MAKINESTENYLEAILILSRRNPVVRAVDIAEELNFTKPSVSVAMKKLLESGDIEISRQNYITLTPKGLSIAHMIYERHLLISNWLITLGVDPAIAREDACRIEHVLSPESFQAIKDHVKESASDAYEETRQELNSSEEEPAEE
ncbi:MAG: metal-dependent transcriptional regulator [Eubacterium sp.]|nr:metal-dependent transcriptional regulator [Eubacterium sp.]